MALRARTLALLLTVGAGLPVDVAAAPPPLITFGHVLSDFNGTVRMGQARVAVDRSTAEAIVAEGRDVRVFNSVGMQEYVFHTPANLGAVLDLAILGDGDILTLALDLEAPGETPRVAITRHDFRGERVAAIELVGLPPELVGFLPNRVFFRQNRLWLANTTAWALVVAGPDGQVERVLDLARILGIPDDKRGEQEITGLAVDESGRTLLTCAVRFRAYEISAEGQLVGTWGEPGSNPGMFAIVSGIDRDDEGRIFVADKNRGVVMIFDPGYRLLAEFGGDPEQGGVLGLPANVVVDGRGKAYVTQIGQRGVWTYDVRPNATDPVSETKTQKSLAR